MTRKTIYLHAGMHKTGSTSIQYYLRTHHVFFAEHGMAVLMNSDMAPFEKKGPAVATNSYGLAHILLRPELATPVRLRDRVPEYDDAQRAGAIALARETIANKPSESLIISAEAFSFLKTPEERDLLLTLTEGHILRPIVFLRERLAWLASWQRQSADLKARLERKGRMINGKVVGYAEHVLDSSVDSAMGWHEDIRNFFGPDATYLSYENALARDGSVIPDFLRALGLDPDECPDPSAARWHNRTRYDADDD